MTTIRLQKILPAALGLAAAGLLAGPAAAEKFPSKPIELVCTTSPGSGAASWCHMVADNLQKKEFLGVPVKVSFKSGGSNNEPVVYVQSKPADGYTLMHISASFTGYFNLPHFKHSPKDFDVLARMEQHIYALAVRSDSPFKTYQDMVAYAKKNPGRLSLGSNKIGSIHHRHQETLHQAQGLKIRFVPYKGTGDVVKDVIGGHLKIGMAQPGKWQRHVKAGKARVLLLLNETRMNTKLFKDVPVPSDLGIKYSIPHQFQGFMLKKGTPPDRIKILQTALSKISTVKAYKKYIKKQSHVIPSYNGDTAKLNAEMAAGTKKTRALMVKLGILKK
jgi:tripartite-type tricarboxylate transporter receptor subunit TctC